MQGALLKTRRTDTGLLSLTGIISLVLTVLLVVIFARLGLWQMARAQEKIMLMEAQASAGNLKPLESLKQFQESELYRPVRLTGRFDFENQFLVDNRIYNGQAGFEVLTPFYQQQEGDGALPVVMVNQGWIAGKSDRTLRPVPGNRTQPETGEIVGLLATPSKGFTLGDSINGTDQSWPVVLQYIDYDTIAQKLDNVEVLSAVVISSPEQPGSYTYNWQPVANGPEKHYGYAFQWFALLLAVITLFVYLNFIKKDE